MSWDGKDQNGGMVEAGTYVLKIQMPKGKTVSRASVGAGPYHPAGVAGKRSWRVVIGALGRLAEPRCDRRQLSSKPRDDAARASELFFEHIL
jgi:hypothetical protein